MIEISNCVQRYYANHVFVFKMNNFCRTTLKFSHNLQELHSKIFPEYEVNRIIIFCLISNKLVLGCQKLLCKLCFSRKRLEKSPVRAYLY